MSGISGPYGTSRNSASTLDQSPVQDRFEVRLLMRLFRFSCDDHCAPKFAWMAAETDLFFILAIVESSKFGIDFIIADYILKLRTSTCVLSRNALVAMVYIGLLFSCSP